MANRLAYKVVYKGIPKVDNRYTSGFAPRPHVLEYGIFEQTYPKFGKVFVFDTLENARSFKEQTSNDMVILSGVAENIVPSGKVMAPYQYDDFPMFWILLGKNEQNPDFVLDVPPTGTMICDSFFPIEVVWPPDPSRQVLALVESMNELGASQYYEVIYHNGEEWHSYFGSETFKDGEKVLKWAYADDVLPMGEQR